MTSATIKIAMEKKLPISKYWFENLPTGYPWSSLWYDYTICGNCGGIRKSRGNCPVCLEKLPTPQRFNHKSSDGIESEIISNSLMGAEGRYEDYIYLNMIEDEWKRPESKFDKYANLSEDKRPAIKAIIVLVFWIYFETRIERLLDKAMADLPDSIRLNLFRRYQSISSRIDDLYKVLFGKSTSYYLDLDRLGFQNVAELLNRIQDKRNEFMHGKPEAINDDLIEDIVSILKTEHESWIAVFNLRVAKTHKK